MRCGGGGWTKSREEGTGEKWKVGRREELKWAAESRTKQIEERRADDRKECAEKQKVGPGGIAALWTWADVAPYKRGRRRKLKRVWCLTWFLTRRSNKKPVILPFACCGLIQTHAHTLICSLKCPIFTLTTAVCFLGQAATDSTVCWNEHTHTHTEHTTSQTAILARLLFLRLCWIPQHIMMDPLFSHMDFQLPFPRLDTRALRTPNIFFSLPPASLHPPPRLSSYLLLLFFWPFLCGLATWTHTQECCQGGRSSFFPPLWNTQQMEATGWAAIRICPMWHFPASDGDVFVLIFSEI